MRTFAMNVAFGYLGSWRNSASIQRKGTWNAVLVLLLVNGPWELRIVYRDGKKKSTFKTTNYVEGSSELGLVSGPCSLALTCVICSFLLWHFSEVVSSGDKALWWIGKWWPTGPSWALFIVLKFWARWEWNRRLGTLPWMPFVSFFSNRMDFFILLKFYCLNINLVAFEKNTCFSL